MSQAARRLPPALSPPWAPGPYRPVCCGCSKLPAHGKGELVKALCQPQQRSGLARRKALPPPASCRRITALKLIAPALFFVSAVSFHFV